MAEPRRPSLAAFASELKSAVGDKNLDGEQTQDIDNLPYSKRFSGFYEYDSPHFPSSPIRLRQQDKHIGTTVWNGALILSRYLEAKNATEEGSGFLKGQKILEIGSGTGLLGLVAARLGASVTLTDQPGSVLDNLAFNVENNEAILGEGSARACSLEWGAAVAAHSALAAAETAAAAGSSAADDEGKADGSELQSGATTLDAQLSSPEASLLRAGHTMVLASDIVYSQDSVAPLLALLLALCPPGVPFLLGTCVKGRPGYRALKDGLAQHFSCEMVSDAVLAPMVRPLRTEGNVEIFTFTRKPSSCPTPAAAAAAVPAGEAAGAVAAASEETTE